MSATRAKLRIYLGSAPGVGKTYAMLNEGRRRAERGTDTVIGFVDTHGRANTAAQIRDLEVIPTKTADYRQSSFEEMDLDAILARRPELVLVDELPHTNLPGSRNTKRWQDIDELLEAGIEVITTVNIQHLESLNDLVGRITGVTQRETVPDAVVRAADQIELVDMSPEALRRRLAHGNVYTPDRVDTALANYFRIGNLTALRELALLWVADKVDEGLQRYRAAHGITEAWETKERVVVALTGSPKGDQLVRRGARMAARAKAELVGVHIRVSDGLSQLDARADLERDRALLGEVGGRYEEITGGDVAQALVEFARAENATQLLLGATRRSRWSELLHGSIINNVIRASNEIDVHVISTSQTDSANGAARVAVLPQVALRGRLAPTTRRRKTLGWIAALIGMPFLALALIPARNTIHVTGALPLLLLGTIGVAATGGLYPGISAALLAFALADWYFITPLHSFTIGRAGDTIALVAFLAAAVGVSMMADQLVRRRLDTIRARSEAEKLAGLAGGALLTSPTAIGDLLNQLRRTFTLDSAAILAPPDAISGKAGQQAWTVHASAGAPPPASPDQAPFALELADGTMLVLSAHDLAAPDRTLLSAFAAQLTAAQRHHHLQTQADAAKHLADENELRNALLAAVSHDLNTPLTAIKASADSLTSKDVTWSPADIERFGQTISAEADRLNTLITNMLAVSRIRAGALHPTQRPVGLEEIVHSALATLPRDTATIDVDIPETFPTVTADPALLERAVANLVDNALNWSPPGRPVLIQAGVCGDHIDLRIVDEGPGIAPDRRDEALHIFQHLDHHDQNPANGAGLGLAVANGFITAMHGELTLDDTPGGGLTATISFPPTPNRHHPDENPQPAPPPPQPSEMQ